MDIMVACEGITSVIAGLSSSGKWTSGVYVKWSLIVTVGGSSNDKWTLALVMMESLSAIVGKSDGKWALGYSLSVILGLSSTDKLSMPVLGVTMNPFHKSTGFPQF